jgi:hypothetical protein
MKSQSGWIALVIVVIAILASGWTRSNGSAETIKWEYVSYQASTTSSRDQEWNRLGAEGWELVAIQSQNEANSPWFVFKRKK